MDKRLYFLLIIVFFLFPKENYSQKNKDPQANLKALWQLMEDNYGNFPVKEIDWRQTYLDQVSILAANAKDKQLFEAMTHLIKPLNDGHVILTGGPRIYVSGMGKSYSLTRPRQLMKARKKYTVGNFSLKAIEKRYVFGNFKTAMKGNFHYGWVNDTIAYFHFSAFREIYESEKIIDDILEEFQDAKAMIIDVRANTGGEDKVGKIIADRFADQRRLYMTASKKISGKKEEFGPKRYWHIEPNGPRQFLKPVILLTSKTSISAAENFALAMHTLPNVTVVGDTTKGIFADTGPNDLPNGWTIIFPNTFFTNNQGICLEGIGVAPDVLDTNKEVETRRDTDRQIESAINILKHKHYRVSKDRQSAMMAKAPNGIEALEKGIFSEDWESVLQKIRKDYLVRKTGHYFFPEELEAISQKLFEQGFPYRADKLLRFNLEIHPDAEVSRKMLRRVE